ncbi:MAG: nitronate monooxygenase [Arachnia sp.]
MSPRLLRSPLPLVGAPMAGGPTTIALAVALADAGAVPFLAAGYKTPQQVADDIAALRPHAAEFGVNLFVPARDEPDQDALRAYVEELRPEAQTLGVEPGELRLRDDDAWDDKLALLIAPPRRAQRSLTAV